jgi:hypothetical protein
VAVETAWKQVPANTPPVDNLEVDTHPIEPEIPGSLVHVRRVAIEESNDRPCEAIVHRHDKYETTLGPKARGNPFQHVIKGGYVLQHVKSGDHIERPGKPQLR